MNFENMFTQAQEKLKNMQSEMQEKLKNITVEGNAGAGMVTVKMNGLMETTNVTISEDAYKEGATIVSELIAAAFNDAKQKVDKEKSGQLGGMAGNMGLPNDFMSFFNK